MTLDKVLHTERCLAWLATALALLWGLVLLMAAPVAIILAHTSAISTLFGVKS